MRKFLRREIRVDYDEEAHGTGKEWRSTDGDDEDGWDTPDLQI